MGKWVDCIVSHFDLIGIREMITAGKSRASDLMRQLHILVNKSINFDMPAHHHAYAWNDSAMFLAFPQCNADYEIIMRELNTLKPLIDNICPSYVISIKGQAIPEPACGYGTQTNGQPRFIFIRASSYAFANCFLVEEELCKKKQLKMDWYVDSRIVAKISDFTTCDQYGVVMLPDRRKRDICVLKGQIWQ